MGGVASPYPGISPQDKAGLCRWGDETQEAQPDLLDVEWRSSYNINGMGAGRQTWAGQQ